MSLLVVLAFGWLGIRALLLLSQVARHSPEAELARSFEEELRQRGLRSDSTGLGVDP